MSAALKAPFPWMGGKRRAAHLVWPRFGVLRNYVEPFAGSLAVMLANPHPPKSETVNDVDCYLANFWRAVQQSPEEVARWADAPVNEADLHARHQWLVNRAEFRERMKSDPDFFDAKIAGWWVWGLSMWIGGGWCAVREDGAGKRTSGPGAIWRKRPMANALHSGNGVHGQRVERRRPHATPGKAMGVQAFAPGRSPDMNALGAKGVHRQMARVDAMGDFGANRPGDLISWFGELQARLRFARVICGDWTRVLTPTPLGLTDNVPGGFVTGVFFDPPYAMELRDSGCYACDEAGLSAKVREWALAHGDDRRLRIAICGYEGEHQMPDTWECVAWKAGGGFANQYRGERRGKENASKERIWFSPHCLRPERDELALFAETEA